MEKKTKSFLKVSTILSWLIFLGLCVVVSQCDFKKNLETVVSVFAFAFLILAIILTVAFKKLKSRDKKTKEIIDDNILAGRKTYKKVVKDYFTKYAKLVLIVTVVLIVPFMVYYLINFDKVMLITFVVTLIAVPAITLPTIYVTAKFFYFAYKEMVFNGETFVLFVSKERISNRYFDPTFHVVYKGKEYVEQGRIRWVGVTDSSVASVVDEILFQTVSETIDWFNDSRFANFIRIDVETEKSGKVQCVYKIGTRRFIISENLGLLKGCFETSRSMRKVQKKKKKK